MSTPAPCHQFLLKLGSVLIFLVAAAMPLPAQAPAEDVMALRDKAFQFWEQGNYDGALPLLEKLAVLKPDDVVVLERLGAGLGGSARFIEDPEKQKETVKRARSFLLRAKELGDNSDYLNIMLEWIPENGEFSAFSTNKEVDEALQRGEKAFGTGDYAIALSAYGLAYQLDPRNYLSALFSGDVYYRMNQMDQAGVWFARAIEIDPNRETAYRYWADGLMKEGKKDEARAKYIEAIVAEPYGKASWAGLRKWAAATKATLAHPKIETHGSVSGEGDKINITIDPDSLGKSGEGSYWLMYSVSRALWRGEKFKKEFPNEKAYRHSLREEVEALEGVIAVASEIAESEKSKNEDPQVQTLAALKDKGLLEAFVLISRADNGIAQDYDAYRAVYRDKLVKYISEWIISSQPAQ